MDERFVRQHPLWDGRVQVLQVTDMSEQAVQLSALVSARNARHLSDLRCALRTAGGADRCQPDAWEATRQHQSSRCDVAPARPPQ